jgi:putative transposase
MPKKRFIVPWTGSEEKPAIYHCLSRVVDRRFALEERDKEQFRSFMRMYEKFTGCRVLTYCLMCNHVHLLVEVTPRPLGPMTDEELLDRVKAISSPMGVSLLRKELKEAREKLAAGLVNEEFIEKIHARYTYRMHDLSEFMKTLMQRFTQWYNTVHKRRGTLWEGTFKSVVVEDGLAARTMAAYIDLNPVRAGMVSDPAEYRWSGYGEAVGGGTKGDGKRAREGLVRAWMAHKGWNGDAKLWNGGGKRHGKVHEEYRAMLLIEGVEKFKEVSDERTGELRLKLERKGMSKDEVDAEMRRLEAGRGVAIAKRLRWRLRYLSDGAVIGQRSFVDEVFRQCRGQFGPRRKDGARRMRGDAAGLTKESGLWSLRDLGSSG